MISGHNVDTIYLDYEKAYDKVDTGHLLARLRKLGIKGQLGAWLARFLMNRRQAVRVGNSMSTWAEVISGIAQGSVVGPMLFLIFISDMGEDVKPDEALILKYIDDSKVMKGVKEEDDVEKLQDVLNRLYQWQRLNNMSFNSGKFQMIWYGSNQDLKDNTILFSNDWLDVISPEYQVKDLGLQMDEDAAFTPQRHQAVLKAKQKAGWVLRTFNCRDQKTMVTLWKSLIRPHLDYCSQLWAPSNQPGALLEVEETLKAFTRRIKGCWSLTYWERLNKLKLSSMQRRHERYRAIYIWKLLNGLVPNYGLTFSHNKRLGVMVNIPAFKGPGTKYKTLKENLMSIEGAKIFNALPKPLRIFQGSINKFKGYLDEFLRIIPDHPNGYKHMTPDAVDYNCKVSNVVRDWTCQLHLADWSTPALDKENSVREVDDDHGAMDEMDGNLTVDCDIGASQYVA